MASTPLGFDAQDAQALEEGTFIRPLSSTSRSSTPNATTTTTTTTVIADLDSPSANNGNENVIPPFSNQIHIHPTQTLPTHLPPTYGYFNGIDTDIREGGVRSLPHKKSNRALSAASIGASSTSTSNASTGAGGMEWESFKMRAGTVLRQWKRVWDRDGLAGVQQKWRHTALPSQLARAPPHRRALALLALVVILLFLLFLRGNSNSVGNEKAHAILRDSGVSGAIIDRTTGTHRSANKAKVLESFTNPYGFMNLIDPYAGGVFNPSILVLPDTVGHDRRFLFVARGPEKYEVIDGDDTRWEYVLGCFMIVLKRAHLNLPYLARETELETLKLPAKRKVEYLRCHDPIFDQFIGPEDPRLFFTNDGQPLLIYSQTGRSPNICRAIYLIDARVVVPGLSKALKKGGWNAPIVFSEQTDLIRDNQFNIEKNWAPFLGEKDELHFHVSLVPQEVYKYVPGMTLRALDPNPPKHNCLTSIVNAQMNRVKFHHATPLLRATLCRRGECKPDIHNTVLFGMIHVKYHPEPYLFYERRIVTWNVTAPYNYLSVSKPLTYSGTNQADPIFTVSIAWDHPSDRHGLGLNHGFLDDTIVTSFGVGDYGSAYIDILARDLLTDHEICEGFGQHSLFG
ncbi:hypothetical protein MVLG_03938 [Microbotryum lychnidis-dioicae p1A1 Lamole]|uniref:Uncharacterized protein n=1 Tax=Microbotryum lychnidis-dioicae (strain p1A1 Lamole / MvSl-1064) TaxID=683840 RepID=U5H9P9_USTV1|nr:hypothetical protein MVLG_03938 [Microbotryum lychnidis-dioicae p1A1 Lamole]|eukprot:KDE05704.1 hypothetical protein MVLG_03938 [Microbotryum lychnidis-dioicae p1A1 Lamole]